MYKMGLFLSRGASWNEAKIRSIKYSVQPIWVTPRGKELDVQAEGVMRAVSSKWAFYIGLCIPAFSINPFHEICLKLEFFSEYGDIHSTGSLFC